MGYYNITLYDYLKQVTPSYSSVKDLIEQGRTTIFNFEYPLFNTDYKQRFETLIIKHFLQREIGVETIAQFKLKLDEKLNLIMPYYNKKYLASLTDYDFLSTDEITDTVSTDSSTLNKTSGDNLLKQQDTPQSKIDNLLNGTYLSQAQQETTSGESDKTSSGSGLSTRKGRTAKSGSQLLAEYYGALINIDMEVINELNELFMGVW